MQQDTGLLVTYAGYYGIARNGVGDWQLGLEYRWQPYENGVRPTIGFNFNADNSAYLYGGVYWDIEVGEIAGQPVYFSPNFVAGAYHAGSRGKLGGTVEFRTGFELSYEFEDKSRVGIAFNHISNANIYQHNPGAETLLVSYQIPLN